MSLRAKEIDTLNLLREHELVLSRIYQSCAEKFPEYREMWLQIAEDERQHAKIIDILGTKIKAGQLVFNPNRFKAVALQTSLNYLKKQLAVIQNHSISLMEALSISISLEKSLIESRYHEAIAGDSPFIKRLLGKVAAGTSVHAERLEHLWLKKRSPTD